jgi:hypothetical protein
MPTSGPLFTAQSPQLRVFIAAVVACEPEHRALIRNWFEDLVDGTRGVSELPTVPIPIKVTNTVAVERSSSLESSQIPVAMVRRQV